MAENKPLPVVFFNSPFTINALNIFMEEIYKLDQKYEICLSNDSKEANAFLSQRNHGLVIFDLSKKEHIQTVTELVINLAAPIKTGQVKVIGSVSFEAKKLSVFLMKKGCTEILNTTLNARSIQHKVDRLDQIIRSQHLKNGGGSAKAILGNPKKAADKGTAKTQTATIQQEWAPPLGLASDFWIIKNKSDIKYRQRKWLYEIMGPPPSYGKWEKIEKQPQGLTHGDECWAFNPRGSREPLYKDDGVWVFTGRMPEFKKATLNWTFVGTNGTLEFWNGSTSIGARFSRETDGLIIRQNPPNINDVLQNLQNIISTELNEDLKKKDLSASQKKDLEKKKSELKSLLEPSKETSAGGFSGKLELNVEATPAALTTVEQEWVRPMSLASDFWLIKLCADIKYRQGRWMYDIMGPPPSFGKWEKIEKQPQGLTHGDECWAFNPRGARVPFYKNEGVWVFTGRMPEFNWATLSWAFVGANGTLEFWDGDNTSGARFSRMDHVLIVAQNPPDAEEVLQNIQGLLSTDLSDELKKKDLPASKKKDLENKKNGIKGAFSLSKETSAGGFTGKLELTDEAPLDEGENPEVWLERLPDLQVEIIAEFEMGLMKVKLLDFFETELTLQTDDELENPPPGVSVYFIVKGGSTPMEFNVKGDIRECTRGDGTKTNVLIELKEFDPEAITKFVSIFADRQDVSEDFMNAVKGVA
jgi:hypothetical protein